MAELRHYRYFVEIARRGTFTAAEALNMTQSTLSEHILQLERECGSQLFNRRHSGITLTPAGEYLLHQAEVLLAKVAETREGLAGFRHGYQDRLRIASVLGPIQSWLPAALADFVQLIHTFSSRSTTTTG
jgi:DNA-binding transcriptional LysR family regulator